MKGYFRKRGSKWSFTLDVGQDLETGKRKQKTKGGFNTKKEAQAACANLIAELESGTYVDPSNILFSTFAIDYMENQVKQAVRISTYYQQMGVVKKHLLPELGNYNLSKITPMLLQKLYNKKQEEISSSTVKKIHLVLKKIFDKAVDWEMIKTNPTKKVTLPKVKRKEMKVWTQEEIYKFIELSKKSRYHTVYVLALFTGMRRGEILGLRWKDIDFDKKTLSVRQTLVRADEKYRFEEPKTSSSKRSISLPEVVIRALRTHKAKLAELRLKHGKDFNPLNLVFTTTVGTPCYPVDVTKYFYKDIQKVGLSKIRFHDMRHTHATMLLQLGENPKVVSERLGHSEVSMTLDIYSHVLPSMQTSLADKLDAAYQSGQNVVK